MLVHGTLRFTWMTMPVLPAFEPIQINLSRGWIGCVHNLAASQLRVHKQKARTITDRRCGQLCESDKGISPPLSLLAKRCHDPPSSSSTMADAPPGMQVMNLASTYSLAPPETMQRARRGLRNSSHQTDNVSLSAHHAVWR